MYVKIVVLVFIFLLPLKAEGQRKKPHLFTDKLWNMHRTAKSYKPTDGYVHTWIPLITFEGQSTKSGTKKISHKEGIVEVLFFTSSWCIPCQDITPQIRAMEKKLAELGVNFNYIFSHDTLDDARGYIKHFGLDEGIMANHSILKNYHNPPLPTIFIADERGWLTDRFQNIKKKDLPSIKEILDLISDS